MLFSFSLGQLWVFQRHYGTVSATSWAQQCMDRTGKLIMVCNHLSLQKCIFSPSANLAPPHEIVTAIFGF